MNQDRLMTLLHSPQVSEKSTLSADKNRTYVFRVQQDTNKQEIKKAVELMFDVKVKSVNVLNQVGKEKRFSGRLGRQSGYKKAYVTLMEGADIHFGDEKG
ncbi:MAG: rplW [Gammaproteobacteria bacterium]|jgi:large subunit ribosomal protein L23|nr:rplW [Gammaproteobacteria bacterium]